MNPDSAPLYATLTHARLAVEIAFDAMNADPTDANIGAFEVALDAERDARAAIGRASERALTLRAAAAYA